MDWAKRSCGLGGLRTGFQARVVPEVVRGDLGHGGYDYAVGIG